MTNPLAWNGCKVQMFLKTQGYSNLRIFLLTPTTRPETNTKEAGQMGFRWVNSVLGLTNKSGYFCRTLTGIFTNWGMKELTKNTK